MRNRKAVTRVLSRAHPFSWHRSSTPSLGLRLPSKYRSPCRCMNGQLLNRSLGTIGHQSLVQWHTSQLIDALKPRPSLRFEAEPKHQPGENIESSQDAAAHPHNVRRGDPHPLVYAHRSGVNALAIDPFDARMYAQARLHHSPPSLALLTPIDS